MIRKNENIAAEVFNSVCEFTRTIASRQNNKAFANARCASEAGSAYFTGTANFEEANTTMRTGYKDGTKELLNCKDGIKVVNDTYAKKTFKSYGGFAPCVPATIMNMPKTMYRSTRNKVQKPVITLFYDIAVYCDTETETTIKAGRNMYSLVKYLEARGVMVNVYVVDATRIRKAGKDAILCIKVKDSSMPINAQVLSYPLIHPSMLRRHAFKWIETSEITSYKELTSGYGGCTRSYRSVLKCLQDLKISQVDSYYLDVANSYAASSLEDLLKRIGLKL